MKLQEELPYKFVASSLFLEDNKNHIALDNYIKINNPNFNIKLNPILRKTKKDWIKSESYINKKTEQYTKIISQRLNTIHEKNYSDKYWSQFFYIGLKRYITLVYEFFSQVESRFDINNQSITLLSKDNFYTPFDLEDLRDYLSNSEFAQEQLFHVYYELFHNKTQSIVEFENEYKISRSKFKNYSESMFLQNKILEKVEILIFGVASDKNSLKQLMNITNNKVFHQEFTSHFYENIIKLDKKNRLFLSSKIDCFDKFDLFFWKTLETLCPTVFLESFKNINNYYTSHIKMLKNLKYIVSEQWISQHQLSIFIACLREKGVKLLCNEHNGLQHIFLNNSVNSFINIVDLYLTQGWYEEKYNKNNNLISTGIMHEGYDRSNIKLNYIHSNLKKILYMTAPAYAKKTNFNSINFCTGEDSKYYFTFQKRFFDHLSSNLIKNITYRTAPIFLTKKWLVSNPKYFLKQYLNNLEIDNHKKNGLEAMLDSKLVILDYIGSAYIQSFLHNIPTIIFLHENCYLDECVNDLFKEMISVGIVYTDPIIAADFVNNNENSIQEWWLSKEVQKVKNKFLNYGIQGGNVLRDNLLSFITTKKEKENYLTKLNLEYYKGSDLYSDGDIENDILEIVKRNNTFADIIDGTDNWALFYHLTPMRENLLSWYDFNQESSLLEIGGGCGAFSGMFAKKLSKVKVVELSKRRAEIIYNRHNNYKNLEIIAGNLNDISFEEKFDYITLIGVLEYAGKFTEGSSPFKTFLENIKSYLNPNGKILIAIENKFGLKYWAGAPEDHTSIIFDSIDDYPNSKEIQTFGKEEISQLLKEIGFTNTNFYYPMPDYKVPKVIYSDDYLPTLEDFFDTYSPNFDQERHVLFDEKKAYKNIIKNKQFPFFANSFLIEVTL
ncbi:MAG: LIC12162 family transferase [Arcobacter sp.]|uniref:LIC12162 family transferase n=1 Tax=Arcobacter sp. TaxID=1872629 RepID=UPI003AFF7E0B